MTWTSVWQRSGIALCTLALVGTSACRDDAVPGAGDETGTDGGDDGDDGDGDGAGSDDEADADETGGSDDGTDGGEDPTLEYLDPVEHLVRASMALRGARPSLAQIETVQADPDALPGIVDEYLEDPAFGEVIRDLHDDALHVGVETVFAPLPPLESLIGPKIGQSAMQPPLRLAQHVVTSDLPYTELLTADYMLVDEVAATVWGHPYDPDGEAWQVVPMGDRPAAGILAESTFFARYESAGDNYNRGRANAVSRAFLCHDFQSLDIEVGEVDLSDPAAVNDAVVALPECSGCHHSLDPLASNFFGHRRQVPNANQIGSYPLSFAYSANREDDWMETNEREPGYFGQSTSGLEDLAAKIIDDPRFAECTAMRFYGYFTQTPWQQTPPDIRDELEATLVDSNWNAKAMIREIVLSDSFRVAAAIDPDEAESIIGIKKARPYQLGLLIRDLTGFSWQLDVSYLADGVEGVFDLPTSSTIGFKVLGGAGNSQQVLQVARTVNPTTSLFLRAIAAEAASWVVEQDFAESDAAARKLLRLVDAGQTDEAAVREQLAWLFLRLYAQEANPESSEITEIYAVFDGVQQASGDTEHAWKATLTAMLQDFAILYY